MNGYSSYSSMIAASIMHDLVQIHFKIGVGDGILIHLGNPIHLQIALSFESGLCWSISPPIRSFSVRLVLYGYRDTFWAWFGSISCDLLAILLLLNYS